VDDDTSCLKAPSKPFAHGLLRHGTIGGSTTVAVFLIQKKGNDFPMDEKSSQALYDVLGSTLSNVVSAYGHTKIVPCNQISFRLKRSQKANVAPSSNDSTEWPEVAQFTRGNETTTSEVRLPAGSTPLSVISNYMAQGYPRKTAEDITARICLIRANQFRVEKMALNRRTWHTAINEIGLCHDGSFTTPQNEKWPETIFKCQCCQGDFSKLYLIKYSDGKDAALTAWLAIKRIARAHTSAPPQRQKSGEPEDSRLTEADNKYLSRMRQFLYGIFRAHGMYICYGEWVCQEVKLDDHEINLLKFDKANWDQTFQNMSYDANMSRSSPHQQRYLMRSCIHSIDCTTTSRRTLSCLESAYTAESPQAQSPQGATARIQLICQLAHEDVCACFQGRMRPIQRHTTPSTVVTPFILDTEHLTWNHLMLNGRKTMVSAVGINYISKQSTPHALVVYLRLIGRGPNTNKIYEDGAFTQMNYECAKTKILEFKYFSSVCKLESDGNISKAIELLERMIPRAGRSDEALIMLARLLGKSNALTNWPRVIEILDEIINVTSESSLLLIEAHLFGAGLSPVILPAQTTIFPCNTPSPPAPNSAKSKWQMMISTVGLQSDVVLFNIRNQGRAALWHFKDSVIANIEFSETPYGPRLHSAQACLKIANETQFKYITRILSSPALFIHELLLAEMSESQSHIMKARAAM